MDDSCSQGRWEDASLYAAGRPDTPCLRSTWNYQVIWLLLTIWGVGREKTCQTIQAITIPIKVVSYPYNNGILQNSIISSLYVFICYCRFKDVTIYLLFFFFLNLHDFIRFCHFQTPSNKFLIIHLCWPSWNGNNFIETSPAPDIPNPLQLFYCRNIHFLTQANYLEIIFTSASFPTATSPVRSAFPSPSPIDFACKNNHGNHVWPSLIKAWCFLS